MLDARAFLAACTTCGQAKRTCECLHDVRDPSAFVHATINDFTRARATRGRITLSAEEHSELHAEGMAILHKLARDYIAQMDGYEHPGRFSGYAAMFLPRKLGDAWHRMHEEQQLVTDHETGRRNWRYRERAVSLEAMCGADPERSELMADSQHCVDVESRLDAAFKTHYARQREMNVRVGVHLSQGATPADCQEDLGLTAEQVQAAIGEIGKVIYLFDSGA